MFLLAALMTIDVVARHLGGEPVPDLVSYSQLGLVLIVSAGLAYTHVRRRHIGVEFIANRLPAKVRIFTNAVASLCSLAVLVAMTYGSWLAFVDSYESREPHPTLDHVPIWPFRLLVDLSLALMAVIELSRLLNPTDTSSAITEEEPDAVWQE